MDYRSMSLDALRSVARERRIGPDGSAGGRTSWVALAKSDALIAALTANDSGTPLSLAHALAVNTDKPEAAPAPEGQADAMAMLAQALSMLSGPGKMDEGRVREIAKAEAQRLSAPRTLVVKEGQPKGDGLDLGLAHKALPRLVEVLQAGLVPYLYGPPGSGKTHACQQAAKALGVAFNRPDYVYEADSFNAETPDWRVTGYKNVVDGTFISSPFYRCVTGPGLYLGDEIDKASAHVTGAFNMALSNDAASFACGLTTKHEHARFVFAGNTAGLGATPQYPDRSRLPDDFRNRFVFIEWGYDTKLERILALQANPNADAWVDRVQEVRTLVAKAGVPLTVSPRTSINGAKLLALGFKQEEVEAAVLWQHAPRSIVDRVKGEA